MRQQDNQAQLISQIEQAKVFLNQNLHREAIYSELINDLDVFAQRLSFPSKAIIKIVSPSLVLAKALKAKNEANENLRSLYEFQVVSPISQIQEILCHCDLICLLYDSTQQIRQHHYNLIKLAQQRKITLVLLVNQGNSSVVESFANWLSLQEESLNEEVKLPLNNFLVLDNSQQIIVCQQYFQDLASTIRDNLSSRVKLGILSKIQVFFNREISEVWQQINQIRDQYFAGEYLFAYQQNFRQIINQHHQFKQQVIREVKQAINQAKANLINPFLAKSLIFNIQQIINSTKAKIVREEDENYLYLVLEHDHHTSYLHSYFLEFCQQENNQFLDKQWQNITQIYGSGGLKTIEKRLVEDLETIRSLWDATYNFHIPEIIPQPNINLETIVEPHCLKLNSRIIFDYNFTQSSWFRLLISILVGLIIYLVTLLLLGEGRYIGFIIIIFQVINLIIGQDIKKAKLKQHSKELKRIVDQKYQSLVRIITTQQTQTLTAAVDEQCQLYQSQWSEAIAIAQQKLDQLKQTIDQQKSRIEKLEKDRDQIQSYFKYPSSVTFRE